MQTRLPGQRPALTLEKPIRVEGRFRGKGMTMSLVRELQRNKKYIAYAIAIVVVFVLSWVTIIDPPSWIKLTIHTESSVSIKIQLDDEPAIVKYIMGTYDRTFDVRTGEHRVIVSIQGDDLPKFMDIFRTSVFETEVVTHSLTALDLDR
jgi:hypothetical protein